MRIADTNGNRLAYCSLGLYPSEIEIMIWYLQRHLASQEPLDHSHFMSEDKRGEIVLYVIAEPGEEHNPAHFE